VRITYLLPPSTIAKEEVELEMNSRLYAKLKLLHCEMMTLIILLSHSICKGLTNLLSKPIV